MPGLLVFPIIFPLYESLHYPYSADYLGFVIASNFLKNPQPGNDMAFRRIFPFCGNLYIHKYWELHEFSSTLNLRGSEDYGKSVFSFTFPVLCKFTFPKFWELYGFLLHPKQLRNPLLWNVCFFPYFSRIIGIHFSHVLGIVWISASSEIFKKAINLKCLCFPILFPCNGNPLYSCFGNCLNFCFKQKILQTLNFEMFVFSHIFPYYRNSLFPYFGNCMDFCFTQNI